MKNYVSLTKLSSIYNEALKNRDFTLAFEIPLKNGRFVLFMFFSDNDKASKDKLYIYFVNTKRLLQVKLYGNHNAGDFRLYLSPSLEQAIRDELGINQGQVPFNLEHFLIEFNKHIPQQLPKQIKMDVLRDNYQHLRTHPDMANVVSQQEKIYWLGFMKTNGVPREKTLRKLYIHTQCNAKQVDELLEAIKPFNLTLRWTDAPDRALKTDFVSMINQLNTYQRLH